MHFCHSDEIWRDFPELVPGVLLAEGITDNVSVISQTATFSVDATARLQACSEGEMPEIQAWRCTFSKMGLKPTQYRCASESLLRRFRKEKSLPQIHPLIDLCNSISLAFAIPVAVFDVSKIAEYIEVRYANGSEVYSTLSGELENPEPGEVIFVDSRGPAERRSRRMKPTISLGQTNMKTLYRQRALPYWRPNCCPKSRSGFWRGTATFSGKLGCMSTRAHYRLALVA